MSGPMPGPDGTRKCGVWKLYREKKHFFDLPYCIFCAIDAAEKNVSKLQDMLNFAPPRGGSFKKNCRRCKEFNWWVNLNEKGYCSSCIAALKEIKDTPFTSADPDLEMDIDDILSQSAEEL